MKCLMQWMRCTELSEKRSIKGEVGMTLLDLAKEKKVLVTAHRGVCGGNVPANSLPSFKAALLAGADVIELDVEKSADGELFVVHPGMEPVHLLIEDSIRNYSADEIQEMSLHNWDLIPTQYPVMKLEDALLFLRGKCIVNIDKFWVNPKEISELVHKLGMADQVLIKASPTPENLDAVEKYASDLPFLAVTKKGIDVHEELMKRNIRYVGVEAIFATEEDPAVSEEFLDRLHADGKIALVNAIVFRHTAVLSAGHTDDISISEDPEAGWGWLADRGFDMIQTDFTYQCCDFLRKTGRRTGK